MNRLKLCSLKSNKGIYGEIDIFIQVLQSLSRMNEWMNDNFICVSKYRQAKGKNPSTNRETKENSWIKKIKDRLKTIYMI